jgi:chemotaxis family two-component system response regulator Rcp1
VDVSHRHKAINVLLVEDNHGDVMLIRQALKTINAALHLHVAVDGIAGLEFVRRGSPRPDVIILDLNLPGKSGSDVLRELKGDSELTEIPVVVFSSSAASSDVQASYRAHASSYIRKRRMWTSFSRWWRAWSATGHRWCCSQ